MAFGVLGDAPVWGRRVRLLPGALNRLVIGGGDERAEFAEFLGAGSGGAEYEADLAFGCDVGGEVGYGYILAVAFGCQGGFWDEGAAQPAHDQLHDGGQGGGAGDRIGGLGRVDIGVAAKVDYLVAQAVAVVKQQQIQVLEFRKLDVLTAGDGVIGRADNCLLYTSPSPRD